jgi:hypothetical protein
MDSQSITHSLAPTPEDSPEPTKHQGNPEAPVAAKKLRLSRILTLVPTSVAKATGKSLRYDLAKHADQERFLATLAASWHRKLKELKREIKIARDLFAEMPRGTTLCGCSSFRQFCEEKLHVSRQGVYEMLGDYHAKRKAKKHAHAASGLRRDQPPKPVLSKYDQQRRDDAAAAAIHLLEAEERGDDAAAMRARDDIRLVSKAEPLRSAIFDNYDVRHEVLALKRRIVKLEKLMLKLLGEIAKADDYQPLPADLMRIAATLRTELAVDAESLGFDDGSVQ